LRSCKFALKLLTLGSPKQQAYYVKLKGFFECLIKDNLKVYTKITEITKENNAYNKILYYITPA